METPVSWVKSIGVVGAGRGEGHVKLGQDGFHPTLKGSLWGTTTSRLG